MVFPAVGGQGLTPEQGAKPQDNQEWFRVALRDQGPLANCAVRVCPQQLPSSLWVPTHPRSQQLMPSLEVPSTTSMRKPGVNPGAGHKPWGQTEEAPPVATQRPLHASISTPSPCTPQPAGGQEREGRGPGDMLCLPRQDPSWGTSRSKGLTAPG